MTCRLPEELRQLYAFPYPIAIWREPPASIRAALAAAEDFGVKRIYTVGDVVTENFIKYGVRPAVAVVDYKTRRHGLSAAQLEYRRVVKVQNPPGYITGEAWSAVSEAVEEEDTLIVVEGEEDLLSLAFIAEGRDDAAVAYGHYAGALIFIPIKPYRALKRLIELLVCGGGQK
ncbi:MAG: GTP-dependent dephospho-CoA kinase family protein [Thermoproteus sp. AZ2]|uniref:GTP-dependent dephospho-CoA kinase family protein n=1 Tax=Thermoproteus sp. AZ2 TaxID=1609232 RepID=A0ACC6UZ89_9CREN